MHAVISKFSFAYSLVFFNVLVESGTEGRFGNLQELEITIIAGVHAIFYV